MEYPDINIIEIFMNAGLVVQSVLLLLLLFSITSWAIILIKARYIGRSYKESSQFIEFFWKSRDLSNAFVKAKQLNNSPVARVFRVGYLELKKSSQSGLTSTAGTAVEDPQSLGARFTGTENINRSLRRAINSDSNLTRMARSPQKGD